MDKETEMFQYSAFVIEIFWKGGISMFIYYFERPQDLYRWGWDKWKEKKVWENLVAEETEFGGEIHENIIISKGKDYGYILSDNDELDDLNDNEFDELILNLLGREKL